MAFLSHDADGEKDGQPVCASLHAEQTDCARLRIMTDRVVGRCAWWRRRALEAHIVELIKRAERTTPLRAR